MLKRSALVLDPKITELQGMFPQDFKQFVLPDGRSIERCLEMSKNRQHPKIAGQVEKLTEDIKALPSDLVAIVQLKNRAEDP